MHGAPSGNAFAQAFGNRPDQCPPLAGEPGTSKTCGICGKWKPNLTLGDKIFCCDRCGVHVDRDTANGARNNFFAALGKAMGIGPDFTSA